VLEVARLLRSRGYTAARDIIRRGVEDSLEYARRMNIRCMLIIGGEQGDGGCCAVRIRDGLKVALSRDDLGRVDLVEYIEAG